MSTALSTNRARPSKDKHAKAVISQTRSEGPSEKVKATPEQMRIAQLTSVSHSKEDAEFERRVSQVMEITGKDKDVCEIALQDCKNDTDRAVNMLLEGNYEEGMGEWRETTKKKKRQAPSNSAPVKPEPTSNHIEEESIKTEPDTDKPDRKDRPESSNRRNRRHDARPPRLARGRGRDKPDMFRSDRMNGGDPESDSNFGTFNNKERDFDSSRGRGRGRGRGKGRGGGSSSGRGRNFNRPQRFDTGPGPQIDTWTNETAENAEKENIIGGWGDMEDWNEDQWTGNLTESKVFTATPASQQVDNTTSMTESSSLGQRLDLGALLHKPTNDTESAFISQFNQQATESIKNSIGIGSGNRQQYSSQESSRQSYSTNPLTSSSLTNHLQSSSLSNQLPSSLSNQLPSSLSNQLPSSLSSDMTSSLSNSQATAAVDALVSTFTQQGQNIAANATLDQINNANLLPVVTQTPSSEATPTGPILQQRPKPQRSKLPPPSKIPASAVEMPGHQNHQMTNLDVQFGNWESQDNSSLFSFGTANEVTVTNSMTSTLPSSTNSTMNNHITQQNESVMASTRISTPPNSGSTMANQESPRSNMYHNSPYTTPTKTDSSTLVQNKRSPHETIPFPQSQSDRKSSPMMGAPRPGSTQGAMQTSKPDSSLNFSQSAPGGYQSSSYHQSQGSIINNTSALTNSTGLSREAPGLAREAPGLTRDPSVLASRDVSGLSSSSGLSNSTGLSNTSGLTNSAGMSTTSGLSNSAGLTNTAGLSSSSGLSRDPSSLSNTLNNSSGLSNAGNLQNSGLANPTGLSNSNGITNATGLSNTAFTNSTTQQNYQNPYQTGSNQYQTSQNQYQSVQNQYQSSSNQYHNQSQYHQNYGQSGSAYPNQNSYSSGSYSSSQTSQNSLYQPTTTSYASQGTQNSSYSTQASQNGSYPSQASQNSTNSLYHQSPSSSFQQSSQNYHRDSQAPGSYSTSVTQSNSYQRDGSQTGLTAPVTQSQTAYSSQTYGSSQHQNSLPSNLQSSPLNPNKLGESLSKMTVKEQTMETRQSPQYDTTSSTTTASLTGTTSTTSLSTMTSTSLTTSSMSITTTAGSSSSRSSSVNSASTTTSKAPPNLPPGVLLGNPPYIMGQGTLPYFAGLQQPMYGYEDLQLLQQRLPLPSYNYEMGFGVPTTLTGRDQNSLANVPYSAADNKLTRVDAQSPIPATQTSSQSSHQQQQQQQHFINLPYGYYYPSVLPNAAAGFQFPGAPMFTVPPVTNTAHAGTTANAAQFQKNYGSHYGSNKGYEDLTQVADFSKSNYLTQSQNKVSSVGNVSAADIAGSGYGKTHTQMLNLGERKSYPPRRTHDAFDKQGFAAGTPPPFNLPLAAGSQAGPMGAPTNPYGTPAQFVPMMPHSQILHPGLHQDSSSGTSRGNQVHTQQNTSQTKANAAKAYSVSGGYWGTS